MERDPELVARDVRRGLVTQEGAERYGVVIDRNGKVDVRATEKLRKKMGTDIKTTHGHFNRGFTSIEELKERCEKETGFPAPEAPRFARYLDAAE